ncbi:MAG: T9SS type A sorting domain-containing protein, partial [Fluviicola sp.]
GNGYSGFSVYQVGSQPSSREYISNQLVSNLVPNSTYQISMWVRLSPNSLYGTKDISVLLSNTQPPQTLVTGVFPSPISVGVNDLLVPMSSTIITNKAGWTQLTANFTAPVGSNFSTITIGNFQSNAMTSLSSVLPVGNVNFASYYYIDDVSIKFLCGSTLSPSFTGATSFCSGSPLTFTSSITGGIATSNVWTVLETDQFGNPIPSAIEWWSPWGTGAAGTYTIPSSTNGGPTLQCGKYYKIKLAVQNACVPWSETSQIIYINCPPTSYALNNQTICNGGCATLSIPGPLKKHTYTWSILTDEPYVIGSGNSITVCPTQNTTYCITTTSSATGCSSTSCATVYVESANPAFSLLTTPASGFQTFKATPIQTTNIPAGFGFVWIVEELDASYNTIYSVNSSNSGLIPCWWNFPGAEDFDGFDGTTTIPTLSSACLPTLGKFKLNTNYRITRGTWSNNCPWTQYSYLIHANPNIINNGGGIDNAKSAQDFSYLMNQTDVETMTNSTALIKNDHLIIYPNPTDGLFTIDLQNIENAQIEIYTVFGQKVKSLSQIEAKTTIDMTGFTKGIYFVKIKSNGKEEISKIILE